MPRGQGQTFDEGDHEMEEVVAGVNQTPEEQRGSRASPKPPPPVYQGDQPEGQTEGNWSPGGNQEEWFSGGGDWHRQQRVPEEEAPQTQAGFWYQGNRYEEFHSEPWGSVAQGHWGPGSAAARPRDPWSSYAGSGRQPGSEAARGQGVAGGKGWTRNSDGVWWEVGHSD